MKHSRLLLLLLLPAFARAQDAGVIAIPDTGWHLWLDRDARWEDEAPQLAGRAGAGETEERKPTGGWRTLDRNEDFVVSLPATVEQHRWGQLGSRPYRRDEYAQAEVDTAARNGAYRGVSWWWRDVDVPEGIEGKRLILCIPGASMRAEVYWNNRLVGGDILPGTPFQCDVTEACVAGVPNRVALRITNPGGRYDGGDNRALRWGGVLVPAGRGFGGLDAGLSLRITDPVRIDEIWVLNAAQPRSATAFVRLVNASDLEAVATLRLDVEEQRNPARRSPCGEKRITLAAGESTVLNLPVALKKTDLWAPDAPLLYRAIATVASAPRQSHAAWRDQRSVTFGFRSLTADGAGQGARLRLNGQRLRLYTAVSRGYWGMNGLWPDAAAAEREPLSARRLGLTCLHARGYAPSVRSLDAHDSLGLLLCLDLPVMPAQPASRQRARIDAVAGRDAAARRDADSAVLAFADDCAREGVLRAVRAARSHPSLCCYILRCGRPAALLAARALLRAVHEEDPSRIAVLRSGEGGETAWMLPWEDSLRADAGLALHSSLLRELCADGAAPAAPPDNPARLLAAIDAAGGRAFDRDAVGALRQSGERMLAARKLRASWPTVDSLYAAIGSGQLSALAQALEPARLRDEVSCVVAGDWESPAAGGRGALVDKLRQPNGDPDLLAGGLRRLQPVLRPDRRIVQPGDTLACDLFLLNETSRANGATLAVTATPPGGDEQPIGLYPVPLREADRCSYAVAARIPVIAPRRAGPLLLRATMLPEGVEARSVVLVVDSGAGGLPKRIALATTDPLLAADLPLGQGSVIEPYQPGRRYDAVIVAERFPQPRSAALPGAAIRRSDDTALYRTQHAGAPRDFAYLFSGLRAPRAAVTFRFAEWEHEAPGERVFDVAVNDETVLENFDIAAAGRGRFAAVDTTVTVPVVNGCVRITVPRARAGEPCFAALRVVSGQRDIAVNCGGGEYIDAAGVVWKPYAAPLRLDHGLLEKVSKGLPMLLLAEGGAAVQGCCSVLGDAGAFVARGSAAAARAPGEATWLLLRDHPVFAGLGAGDPSSPFLRPPPRDLDGIRFDGGSAEIYAAAGCGATGDPAATSLQFQLGKGTVIMHAIPGVASAFRATLPADEIAAEAAGMPHAAAVRLLLNSLRLLKR